MRLFAAASGLLAVGAAVALADCGVAPTSVSKPVSKPVSVSAGHTAGPASPRAALSHEQRAVADANAILASFAVPPGARKLPAAPTVGGGVLKQPEQLPSTPDLVDKSGWWLAVGAPRQVLGWEVAHLPRRFSGGGGGYGSSTFGFGAVTTWFDVFSLPAIPAVLDSRQLIVEVVADGGKTAIRVDSQVTWLPARPAGEMVPSAVRAVTVSEYLGWNVDRRPPKPVTITDPAKVRALAALIDGLPMPPRFGIIAESCPDGNGSDLTLAFSARLGGPALAVATVALSGCPGVDFTIGGKQQPALGATSALGTQILTIAGLPWKTRYPWNLPS
jgi:hypothetical protein